MNIFSNLNFPSGKHILQVDMTIVVVTGETESQYWTSPAHETWTFYLLSNCFH